MTVGIVGVGLIGGSVAQALSAQKQSLWLDDRDPATKQALSRLRLGRVDSYVRWAGGVDTVVLAVPLQEMTRIIYDIVPRMRSTATLIDLSSVKGPVAEALRWAGQSVQVLSLHLMAGREVSGFTAASPDLFRDCAAAVVDIGLGSGPADAIAWWQQVLGCAPFGLWSAYEHDRAMAWVSQLPYLASRAVAQVVQAQAPQTMALAGSGFRDTTRVGKTALSEVLPMLSHNAEELSRALLALESELRVWRQCLDRSVSAAVPLESLDGCLKPNE
ncbi:MAG: prephenate dehydrogenase/arogenate dehydrogenase family protein [Sulfobacillus acidophilus]|uniref:Prephenate dehydrogenase/arogenate dehydrogenase family protein n=1 Tax=Sulfobacillus acidophilus TaxID=53633 RepID=A0A2T2WDS0_9FIRM|nr:MAG: prephenate dehydrogenase/arogenate dehydrogenase family protein [Sulfobacillus acidophilus]